jgi:hypothetical protein
VTNVGYATLDVIPSMKGFQSSVTRGVDPVMSSAGKRAGSRFGSAFRGTLGAIGLFSAASGALRFLGDSVDEGREAVKVGAQTRAVIKSTGGVARVTEKHVGRLAGQLSRLAGVDDEIVQGGANILLTFKNVRNEVGEGNKVFDEANKAALDMSVALDKDLKSSALQVGKALNDPIAGLTALGRAGVQFSADQKDAIKDFVASGDTLSAQKIILKELDEQFKGSARAQRTEADRLKVTWGNFKEEIGTALIPILEDLSRFMRKEGIPKAKEFFAVVRDDGIPALKKVAGFAGDAAGEVKKLVDAFNGMPDWVKKGLAVGAVGAFAAKKLGVGKAIGGQVFSKGATPVNPLYVFVTNPGGVPGGGKVPGGPLAKTGSKIAMTVPQVAIAATTLYLTAKGAEQQRDNTLDGLKGANIGSRGLGGGEFKGEPQVLTWAEKFGTLLDENEDKIFANKEAIEEFGQSVRTRIPRTIETKYTLLGVNTANEQARQLLETLLLVRGAAMDNRLDFGPSGQPPTGDTTPPSRGDDGSKGGGKPASRGVNVNIYGDVRPNDSKEFFGDLQRRSISGSGNGWK